MVISSRSATFIRWWKPHLEQTLRLRSKSRAKRMAVDFSPLVAMAYGAELHKGALVYGDIEPLRHIHPVVETAFGANFKIALEITGKKDGGRFLALGGDGVRR